MPISIGGKAKRNEAAAARFYRAILDEVAELDGRDQTSLALAFTTGQAWEELPEAVKALVSNLVDWKISNGR